MKNPAVHIGLRFPAHNERKGEHSAALSHIFSVLRGGGDFFLVGASMLLE